MLDCFVNEIGRKMALYLNWDEIEEAKFCLGMKVLVHDMIMIVGILILSYSAGVFKESCIIFTSFGFLRLKAGGYHCKKSWQCFLCTSSIVIGGALFARSTTRMSIRQDITVYLTLCVIAILFAPQVKKIQSNSLAIRKIKLETIGILTIYMILSILLRETIGSLLLIAASFEIISLIPSAIINFLNKQ